MSTRNIAPRSNGEGSIGTSIKKWLAGWFETVNATTVNTGSVVATGNVGAATFTGDGSALTGIGSGTGGVINTGSTTIGADSDANGSGEIALQTGGVTRATVSNAGNVGIGTTVPSTRLQVKPTSVSDGISIEGYNTAANRGFFGLNSSGGGLTYLLDSSGAQKVQIDSQGVSYFNGGNVGIGIPAPTAVLAIKAGTAAANTAPLKLTAGTNLTTPESGAIEFDGTNLYVTIGGVRKTIQVA